MDNSIWQQAEGILKFDLILNIFVSYRSTLCNVLRILVLSKATIKRNCDHSPIWCDYNISSKYSNNNSNISNKSNISNNSNQSNNSNRNNSNILAIDSEIYKGFCRVISTHKQQIDPNYLMAFVARTDQHGNEIMRVMLSTEPGNRTIASCHNLHINCCPLLLPRSAELG